MIRSVISQSITSVVEDYNLLWLFDRKSLTSAVITKFFAINVTETRADSLFSSDLSIPND